MTVQEQISSLLDIVTQLQKTLLAQQTMIDKLTNYSSNTASVVTQNAQQALKNDEALFNRLKNAETVLNGILQRERRDVVENIGKAEQRNGKQA